MGVPHWWLKEKALKESVILPEHRKESLVGRAPDGKQKMQYNLFSVGLTSAQKRQLEGTTLALEWGN